jgi:hypothetical protein
MKRLALGMLAAISLGGCTTTYKWAVDPHGQVYCAGTSATFDPDKAEVIGNELAAGIGRFATGAAQGYQNYQYTHPAPVHGSAIGFIGDQSVWINY